MTDYTKLKLIELKDLCIKRNLPTNGIKKDLIARLQESDAASGTSTPQRTAATAHLPSAEEYEINWDEDDTSAATKGPAGERVETKTMVSREGGKGDEAAASRVTTVGTGGGKVKGNESGNPTTDNNGKSQRRKLTELYPDLPSVSKDKEDRKKPGQEKKPSNETKPVTQTTKLPEKVRKEDKDTDSVEFKANLPATTVSSELERRKARLARFGEDNMDSAAKETLKKLERAQRFGTTDITPSTKEVKGLDSALPERRKQNGKRGYDAPVGGRGGVNKKQRYNNVGGRGNNNNNNPPAARKTGSTQRQGILDDPIEKEKAEKRKQRFGN